MAEDKTPAEAKTPEAPPKESAKGAEKKAKPPALEEKPFADFIHQDYLPALKKALSDQGIEDVEVTLQKQKLPMAGLGSNSECWQVIGKWLAGKRQFNVYFTKADIQGQRAFSCSSWGANPSTIEPFLIDERKITLELLVFGVIQRLNAQKWLAPN